MSPDKKKLYMWICAGGVLAVIAIIWVASIKFSISASIVELREKKNDGAKALEEFQNNFKKQIEDLQNNSSAPAATSTITTSTIK